MLGRAVQVNVSAEAALAGTLGSWLLRTPELQREPQGFGFEPLHFTC